MKLAEPVGLVLAGGGALGAWQAGALERLAREISFRHVLGISAGALNGAAYQAGRMAQAAELWRDIESRKPLRLAPRLKPWLTLFSAEPLRAVIAEIVSEEDSRRAGRCRLTVVSLCVEDKLPMMAEFIPDPMAGKTTAPACGMAAGTRAGWDSPLVEHLLASAAIPLVFPPVRMGEGTLIDGGIPGRAPMNLEILSACKSVLILEMGRPDEPKPPAWRPASRLDWLARRTMRRMMDEGTDSLRHVESPPAVFRLCPSKRLDYLMLSFKSEYCAPALELGRRDAESFLSLQLP